MVFTILVWIFLGLYMIVFAFYQINTGGSDMSLASQKKATSDFLWRNPECRLKGEITDVDSSTVEERREFLHKACRAAELLNGFIIIADKHVMQIVDERSRARCLVLPQASSWQTSNSRPDSSNLRHLLPA